MDSAVADSTTTTRAPIVERVKNSTCIDIDSGVNTASGNQEEQNPISAMETDICDDERDAIHTETIDEQELKTTTNTTESPKVAKTTTIGPKTLAAIEEVHRKRAVSKKNKKSKQLKPPILDFADETIHTINLLMLTMLVHTSKDCLLCQLAANY